MSESSATVSLLAQLERDLDRRRAAGLWRQRRTLGTIQGPHAEVDGRQVLAFASNDYLGLAQHPSIHAALRDGVERWGAGAGASHLIAGHFEPHEALEAELARFVAPCEGARALTFSSGYLANLAIVSALVGRDDAVFADRLDHACLNDGALLSRAKLVRYGHRDLAALERGLERSRARRKLIATDAVFSMDGTVAPVRELVELAKAFDAVLLMDDAHGFGVLGEGRGTAAHYGVASPRLVVMGTLGKAGGVAGAFVAAHAAVIETLIQAARPYVYSTAAPPALAAALCESVRVIREGAALRAHLQSLVAHFRARASTLAWPLMDSATAIQPLLVGHNEAAVALSEALWQCGIWVPAIRPPTVPAGTARLRISLSAAHTHEDVVRLLAALERCARDSAASRSGCGHRT